MFIINSLVIKNVRAYYFMSYQVKSYVKSITAIIRISLSNSNRDI